MWFLLCCYSGIYQVWGKYKSVFSLEHIIRFFETEHLHGELKAIDFESIIRWLEQWFKSRISSSLSLIIIETAIGKQYPFCWKKSASHFKVITCIYLVFWSVPMWCGSGHIDNLLKLVFSFLPCIGEEDCISIVRCSCLFIYVLRHLTTLLGFFLTARNCMWNL